MTEDYSIETAIPNVLEPYAGPHGMALVRAFDDGRTDPGWGLESPSTGRGFMPRYNANEFNPQKVLRGYEKGHWNFAIVMRSLKVVCLDIDGKNGGLLHAKKLGALPYTLAETSKSGDGYHLFYTLDDQWDDLGGFAELGDRIGIVQGVDFRGTGCVFHHPQQRWNKRWPMPLPPHLHDLLMAHQQKHISTTARIVTVLANEDPMEVLMMQDELLEDLKKPIDQGKRNQTLFAIGQQLKAGAVPDWEDALHARALQVGLPQDEADKLVKNVGRYGVKP